jgi:hypothetical protein
VGIFDAQQTKGYKWIWLWWYYIPSLFNASFDNHELHIFRDAESIRDIQRFINVWSRLRV